MNIRLISFVGVDKQTDQVSLHHLQKNLKYRLLDSVTLEFSVLFSYGRKGGRYSTIDFCNSFLDSESEFSKSLHLCGKEAIDKFINEDSEMESLSKKADRIQLNFSTQKHDKEKIVKGIISAINRGHHIILQQNKSKSEIVELVKSNTTSYDKLSLLYDSSGGFGREIKQVEPPDEKCFTGYAGGIKPENVSRIVEMIESKNINGVPYYIDMESGIRTDNVFDVIKCLAVINKVFTNNNS